MNYKIFTLQFLLLLTVFADEQNWDKENSQVIDANLLWNKTLEGVDFLQNEDLFRRMIYIYPQSPSSFETVEGCCFAGQMGESFNRSASKFFKGGLLDLCANCELCGYYFCDELDNSLILREFESDSINYSVQESDQAILLNMHFHDWTSVGISAGGLYELLINNFNVDSKVLNELELTDSDEIIPFGWHSDNFETDIERLDDWANGITVFVTKKGVSVLLFKVFPDLSAGYLTRDKEWLNKYLCNENGELIDESYEYYTSSRFFGKRVRKKADLSE